MKVLVLHTTGLHLGYLGCYGNEWVDTPALDRLAAEGVVFDQHYADTPAARTAWTGRYHFPTPGALAAEPAAELPALLAAHHVPFTYIRPSGEEKAAELLRWILAAVRAAPRGVVWVDLPSLLPPWSAPPELLERYLGDGGEGEEDEEEDSTEPLTPLLDPPAGAIDVSDYALLDRLQSSYAAAVAWHDSTVGELLDALRSSGELDALAVVVTSDRGIALGERGQVLEWPSAHEEIIHLPLVVRLPGAVGAGRRVGALTQSVDILPTLLDLQGISAPADCQGHSLLSLMRGPGQWGREYAVAALEGAGVVAWALRTSQWGLLIPACGPHSGLRRLHVKPEDRWDVNDVAQHHPDLADALERTLHAFVEAAGRPGLLIGPPLSPMK